MSEEPEWEVEKIIQRGHINQVLHYLVQWKGCSPDEATWEPVSNLQNCRQRIIDFEQQMHSKKLKGKNKKESKKKVNADKVFTEPDATEAAYKMKDENKRHDESAQIISSSPQSESEVLEPKVVTSRLDRKPSQKSFIHGQIESRVHKPKRQVVQKESPVKIAEIKRFLDEYEQDEEYLCGPDQPPKRMKIEESQLDLNRSVLNEGLRTITEKSASKEGSQEESQRRKQFNSQEEQANKGETAKTKPGKVDQKNEQTSKNQLNIIKLLSNCEAVAQFEQSGRYQSTANVPKTQRNNSNFQARYQHRYEYCDEVYTDYKLNMLKNITRKMENKALVKPSINMIDMTQKRGFLKELDSIKEVETETAVSRVELMVKVDYGWLAIGKSQDNEHIMLDVSLIKEDCWDFIVEAIKERKEKT